MSQSRLQAEPLQAPDRDKAGDDTGRPVEVAAIANGVEMRSGHEARRTSVVARQRHEEVGGVITASLEAHGVGARCDQPVARIARPAHRCRASRHRRRGCRRAAHRTAPHILLLGHDGAEDIGGVRGSRRAATPWQAAGAVTLGFRVSAQTSLSS